MSGVEKMDKFGFLEQAIIAEARRSDLTYNEKRVKEVLDRVEVEFRGKDSAPIGRLLSAYEKLEEELAELAKKRTTKNQEIKGLVEEFFDAEDVVLTRVLKTANFALTLSKLEKSKEVKSVDFDKFYTALLELISEDLRPQVEALKAAYTAVETTKPRSPALRVGKIEEGHSAPIDLTHELHNLLHEFSVHPGHGNESFVYAKGLEGPSHPSVTIRVGRNSDGRWDDALIWGNDRGHRDKPIMSKSLALDSNKLEPEDFQKMALLIREIMKRLHPHVKEEREDLKTRAMKFLRKILTWAISFDSKFKKLQRMVGIDPNGEAKPA